MSTPAEPTTTRRRTPLEEPATVEKIEKDGRVYVADPGTREVYGSYPAALRPDPSGHLEVLMGPGETITVSVDGARASSYAPRLFRAELVDLGDGCPRLRVDHLLSTAGGE